MSTPRYLTKSRFKLAVECPTKLYYASHSEYGNVKDSNEFLRMLAEGGYQVGELARCLYLDGVEVRERDHADAESVTRELLKRDHVVLFEPALRFGDLFVRVDILVKQGNDVQLIEVKAKSYDSTDPKRVGLGDEIPAAMRPYIEDVAFQRFVLSGAIPAAKVSAFLLMPDKSVAVTVAGMNQLFEVRRNGSALEVTRSPRLATEGFGISPLAMVNVDALVERVLTEGVRTNQGFVSLDDAARTWALAVREDRRIPPMPGAQCASCEFQSTTDKSARSGLVECWNKVFGLDEHDFTKGTVLDLWNYRRKQALIDARRVRLDDVRREDLGAASDGPGLSDADRQWMQVKGIPPVGDRGGYWISRDLMRAEMAGWRYPLHMIDFETSAVALPFHRGMRPYEQVAFQFSHHVIHADGRVEHAGEFLASERGRFPNFDFARALQRELSVDDGTVFMWSPHEHTILARIVRQLLESDPGPADRDQLVAFLRSLLKGGEREMYDLAELAKRAFFHPDTRGSSSIKKLLPAMLNCSDWLQARYSRPVYGVAGGIPSRNYRDFQWWMADASGRPIEPYERLSSITTDMLGPGLPAARDPDDLLIAEGGAAAMAYSRLQFERLSEDQRSRIRYGLLRYCELDTLAMVMVVEGWREMCGTAS